MLKKLKMHFIRAAMLAFSAVILILVLGINLWNYHATVVNEDAILETLKDYRGGGARPFDHADSPKGGPSHQSRELQYMVRFFLVRYDAQGVVAGVNHEYIASVSSEEAKEYAQAVLDRGRERGFYKGYRYLVSETERGRTVVFLNAEQEIQEMQRLGLLSAVISLGSILAVFVLVVFFSKRAVDPYIRNMDVQKQFITDAGHELKTPLTSISTSADILAMTYEDDEWVRNIQRQSSRMGKLILNLVTLSKLDEEQPFYEKADFSLSDAVWEISEATVPIAAAKGKNYTFEIEENLRCHGNQPAIQQIVSILLDNAIRYSDEQGTIRLHVCRSHKRIEITVFNTCELNEDVDVSRLFDRFYRGDKSRSEESGGTGIGLSIAKAIVEAHGGKMSVETADRKGLTFKVVL